MDNGFNTHQSSQFYIDGVLSGNIAILSRAITLVESTHPKHNELAREILKGIAPESGNSFRLGITGVPGVGKSTFIESFGKKILDKGYKLAVLAIDPSSSKSKGSILGDKTRMEELSTLKNVYIRPSPNSGTLGGIAKATYETILLCEAAGFDFIIIETVGVGQSEITVSGITDFFLLLMLAGAGDELQGIKRGIMEMADAIVITKADGNNIQKAGTAKIQLESALHLLQLPESGFLPKVKMCSSVENTGIEEIVDLIEKYRNFVIASNYFVSKRKSQQQELFHAILNENLKSRFYSRADVIDAMKEIKMDSDKSGFIPFDRAGKLIDSVFSKE